MQRFSNKKKDSVKLTMDFVRNNCSKDLYCHIKECPVMRLPVFGLMMRASRILKKSGVVVDVGAGDTPYRELFNGNVYYSTDFNKSKSHKYGRIDYVCESDILPFTDNFCDAIICTEVLEHVFNVRETIMEFNRVLKPSGLVFISVPFIMGLHEEPYDFFRYTKFGLRKMLLENKFKDISIKETNNGFIAMLTILAFHSKNPTSLLEYFLYYLLVVPSRLLLTHLLETIVFIDKKILKIANYPTGYLVTARKR